MGGKAIMPDVVSYLSARAGEPVALPQLAAGVGVEPGPIQKALSNAISSGVYGTALTCVHRGQVWMWNGGGHTAPVTTAQAAPPATPAPVAPAKPKGLVKGDMVEVIGLTQDGQAVARDENGQLYRVVPL